MSVSAMHKKYSALKDKLHVLDPIEIPDEEWKALEAGTTRDTSPVYRNALPIVVAQFKQAVAEEIMSFARKQGKVVRELSSLKSISQDYKSDIALLDAVLFKPKEIFFDLTLGKFTEAQVTEIHADGSDLDDYRTRFYVARLDALPTHYIRAAEVNALSSSKKTRVESLVHAASYRPVSPEVRTQIKNAKEQLINMGVLKPLPLGSVGLMVYRDIVQGTLHCSAELPARDGKIQPTYSAFFRAVML